MDGRNRCLDNIYHRTVPAYGKYEDIYLRRYAAVMELRKMLKSFISYYNTERAHQRLHDQTPDAIRFSRFVTAANSAPDGNVLRISLIPIPFIFFSSSYSSG